MPAMHSEIRVGLIGDYKEQHRAHQAIPRALQAAADGVELVWIPTDSATDQQSLAGFDGFWCVPGMPYRSADGAMAAIRHARVTRTPFLGTSAGFQYAILEFAKDVLGLSEAEHHKANPKARLPLITELSCALAGAKARVRFAAGSRLRSAYGATESIEEYHCSHGFNNRYRRLFESNSLCIAAVDDQDDVRAIELDNHPFFIATLFQPEMRADGSPLVHAFVKAAATRKGGLMKAAS
jgi:CTP synthase (UTP-ammonia lyase)